MSPDADNGNVFVSNDWWGSGWTAILPRQALFIEMVVSTASVKEIDGGFLSLVGFFGHEAFEGITGGLNEPIWWSYPDLEEDDEEQRAIDVERRREFEEAMGRAGRQFPLTVFDLAILMADLGIFDRTLVADVERWRKVQPTPLASEALPVSSKFVAEQDEIRWTNIQEVSAQLIICHIIDLLGSPPTIETSLARLATEAGLEIADLRFGLSGLLSSGFELVDPATFELIDPESVDEEKTVSVLIDWLVFSENRIGLTVRGRPDFEDEP